MNTLLPRLYQYIGQQINGSLQEKSIFICWLSLPIYLLIGFGCLAGLILSRWTEEIYNPLLWAGVIWGCSATLFWASLGYFSAQRDMSEDQGQLFAQLTIALFGVSGILSMLLVGPFNLVTGIVLTGSILIGMLLFPAQKIALIFALSIAAILAYAVTISLGGTHYQPLLEPVHAPAAQLWYDLMVIVAATLIIFKDSFTVAALTSTWRHREARTLLQASTDPLTGVANRGYATQVLEQAFLHAEQSGKPLSVVLVDVDHFKQINDRYGHQTGDLALQLVAHSLRDTLRDNDLVGRYGGEEFLLILPGSDAQNAIGIAERCAQALRNITIPGIQNQPALKLTASFGVHSEHASADSSPGDMIEKADIAMYQAKRAGRDRVISSDRMNPPR